MIQSQVWSTDILRIVCAVLIKNLTIIFLLFREVSKFLQGCCGIAVISCGNYLPDTYTIIFTVEEVHLPFRTTEGKTIYEMNKCLL